MRTFYRVLLLFWMFSPYLLVNSHPTIQCAHTGSGFSSNTHDRQWHLRQGPFTIGAKNFDSVYGGAMYSGFRDYGLSSKYDTLFRDGNGTEKPYCPYNYNPHNISEYGNSVSEIELCDEEDERAIIRVNAVQQTDSSGIKHTLAGWLHLEVELTNKTDQIRMIYAQMYDEHYNAIGEFVMDPSEQCGASKHPDKYITPTSYQYLPCSAIGAREAKPSQAAYMVHKGDVVNQTVKASPVHFPAKDLTSAHGVHFTWRMNEYWCSRHYRITPMVFVLTTNEIEKWRKKTNDGKVNVVGLYRMLRKAPRHWLRPIWFGAADIKHPGRGPLECSNPVINDEPNSSTDKDANWILQKLRFFVRWEYFHQEYLYPVKSGVSGSETCQLDPFPFEGLEVSPAFGGRCNALDSKNTSSEYLQTCNKNTSSKEFQGLNITFQTYGNYVVALHNHRSESCGNPCRAPLSTTDAEVISNITVEVPKRVDLSDTGLTHKTRTQDSISKFWRGRKFHGVLCIIVSMFLMPVSLFSARYYKETFMKFQCKGGHLWYWIHIGTSLISMAMLFSSQTALSGSIGSWGRSQDAFGVVHDVLGWMSHAGFICLFILGGLRGMQVPIRKILMTAHSVVGFLHYVLNLCLICLSTMIPASPSLSKCGVDGLPTGFSPVAAIVISWAVVDIIFHILLTFLVYRMDTSLEIRRGWYCPIIPILPPDSHEDMKGSVPRKLLFALYIGVSGIMTLVAVLLLTLTKQPGGCIFGETSCKGALGCTSSGIALCKRLQYSVCE